VAGPWIRLSREFTAPAAGRGWNRLLDAAGRVRASLEGTGVALHLAPDVPPHVLRGLKTKPAELYRLLRAWHDGPR
jgi:hypothetical protein